MRRLDAYDPDEGGRYDGDDAASQTSRFNQPAWLEIVREQEAARQAAWEESRRRARGLYHTPQPGERSCPTCKGTGDLHDSYAYGPPSMTPCHRCDGLGYLA